MDSRNNLFVIACIIAVLPFWTTGQEKCGAWRIFERSKRIQAGTEFPTVQTRPAMHKSIVSPKGLFRIHFDTTGTNTPAMVTPTGVPIPNSYAEYVDSVAAIYDQVYEIIVGHFGFPAPVSDGSAGGGNENDVYLENLGTGNYGSTDVDENVLNPGKPNPRYSCFIKMDNDFEGGYYTIGLDAVRVTAAHEFHHLIQVSTSGLWSGNAYFYEMCATGIESTVFPAVKDYIQYIKTYYNNTSAWPLFLKGDGSGYERAVFPKFLMEKFGPGMMNAIWNEVKSYPPVRATQEALNAYSTSLEREFSEFSLWNYYTNYRSDSILYFDDAKLFPSVRNFNASIMVNAPALQQGMLRSFSVHYNRVISNQSTVDTVDYIVTNTNYTDALNGMDQSFPYELITSPSLMSGSQTISPNIYSKFTASDNTHWKNTTIFKNGIVKMSTVGAFPVPLDPSASSLLIDIRSFQDQNDISLTILSASTMDAVYSNTAEITSFSGTQYAEWKGRDNGGNIVPSGIYMYILSKGSSVVKGKFAVIR